MSLVMITFFAFSTGARKAFNRVELFEVPILSAEEQIEKFASLNFELLTTSESRYKKFLNILRNNHSLKNHICFTLPAELAVPLWLVDDRTPLRKD